MYRCFNVKLLESLINSTIFKNNLQINHVRSLRFLEGCTHHSQPSCIRTCHVLHKKQFTIKSLIEHLSKEKPFYLKQLKNVLGTIQFENLEANEAIILLDYCNRFASDCSRKERETVCQDIFNGLKKSSNIDIDVYNTYLKVCNKNRTFINHEEFLKTIRCKPNEDTYRLLLENACQHGNVVNALIILELMKSHNITLDVDSFNNLILGHVIYGGLKSAEGVLKTMRLAHIPENTGTKLAIFKGVIRRKNFTEFKSAINEYSFEITENELLVILEELGLVGNDSWISEIDHLYKYIVISREIALKIENICIHLIHMEQPTSAMRIYQKFIPPTSESPYGFTLLKEMLHCNIDVKTIISLAQEVVNYDGSNYILENLTEVALKCKFTETAWALLGALNNLRPHYFWPLFIQEEGNKGESGVLSVIKKMRDLNVICDSETMETYILPYCDVSSTTLLINKLQDCGFTIRSIISPLLVVLLKGNKTKQAAKLCNMYNVRIAGDTLLEALCSSWSFTKDSSSVLTVLKRFCESNVSEDDLVGKFLINCFNSCKSVKDFKDILVFFKIVKESQLRINSYQSEILQELCEECSDDVLKSELKIAINSLLDFRFKIVEPSAIPQPKDMDIESLESHLIELEEKNMNTRGVLRKLIQQHARAGNFKKVNEFREKFISAGYEESPGLKSSIMHSFVMGEHFEEAFNMYKDIRKEHPKFVIDSFKFIDLAKLLIKNDRWQEGYNILQNESPNCKVYGNTDAIQRNCRELLSVCKTEKEINMIFKLLTTNGLCKPTNVMLGPLVKIHLVNEDIPKAVQTYEELSKKHNCTPLQLEVIRSVTKIEDSTLLQKVLNVTETIHGAVPTYIGLIAALAENGQEKELRKVLNEIKYPIKVLLERRCKRWVKDRKIEPLLCLAKTCDRLSSNFVNVDYIYHCIFELFDVKGLYTQAKDFYESIPEDSDRKLGLQTYLKNMLSKCNISRKDLVSNKN